MKDTINLSGGGFVRLDDSMADDLSVVNSARVSFGKRQTSMTEEDEKLINFLMREHHGTPFEHNSMRFHISVPIFVAREWFRHRIGWSYNEFSGRYTKIPNNHWSPELGDIRTQVGKPGAYTFEPVSENIAADAKKVIDETSEAAWRTYNYLLGKGVAKEVARAILPVGTMTEFYATCNARSLMSFLQLRNSPHAQREIRIAAEATEQFFKEIMPITHRTFIENGRIAP